jgi:DNA-binding MarR family transcriptional regulator
VQTIQEWRLSIIDADISSNAKLVALILASHLKQRTGIGTVSNSTLARQSGLGRSSVDRALRKLKDAGWIHVEPSHDDAGSQKANSYAATYPGEDT